LDSDVIPLFGLRTDNRRVREKIADGCDIYDLVDGWSAIDGVML